MIKIVIEQLNIAGSLWQTRVSGATWGETDFFDTFAEAVEQGRRLFNDRIKEEMEKDVNGTDRVRNIRNV